MKRIVQVLATAAFLALAATAANATTVIGVSGVTGDVAALDWNPGNALVAGGVPLSQGTNFDLYYQAVLANFNGTNGNPITANGGLNSTYELTAVGGFGETTTSVTALPGGGSSAVFGLANTGTNFFRIYRDTTPDANNLLGTGFTDGDLVLSGHVSTSFGTFAVNTTDPNGVLQNLDQFGSNDWVGTKTVAGSGGSSINVVVDSYDSTYFTLPPQQILIDLFFNTSNILPFLQVDPSRQFTDKNGNLFASNIGAINGIYGPNMLFQADANSSPVVTPEPSTIALLGAGLFGMGIFARRRNKN